VPTGAHRLADPLQSGVVERRKSPRQRLDLLSWELQLEAYFHAR
jgi:hypothetical protein